MSDLLGLLVFDHLNDIIYIRCNKDFIQHVQALAITQGLSQGPMMNLGIGATKSEDPINQEVSNSDQGCLDPNVIVQLFSPIVTSQRIMGSQFKNSYESISCDDGTTLVFQEYSSFLFLCIGSYSESYLRRFMNVSMQMVQLIVGPCVSLLKSDRSISKTLDNLLAAWLQLYSNEQSYLVEAIERLIVSPEVSSTSIDILANVVNSIVKDAGSGHAMFFVRNKLLSLYSSKNADELCESDVLALNLLLKANSFKDETFSCLDTPLRAASPEEGGEGVDSEGVEEEILQDPSPTEEGVDLTSPSVVEHNILLQTRSSALSPHIVHLTSISAELSLVVVTEVNRSQLAGQLSEVLSLLEDLKNEECSFSQVPLIEIVDTCLRKAQDLMQGVSKANYPKIKKKLIQVCNRWESLKKTSLEEFVRSPEAELSSRLEASVSALIEMVRDTWGAACLRVSSPPVCRYVESATLGVREGMSAFTPLLDPKALRNASLGSCSIISITKYMEEFPGLVHFLYIDRSVHQLTAPVLGSDSPVPDCEAVASVRRLTNAKVWSMVNFAREHLAKGHTSLLWKDKTFSYSYFLWFEDKSANPLKPVAFEKDSLEDLPLPGILCGDFYRAFCRRAFPDTPPEKLRSFELFCVHLGMVTSPCILEQTRRLAATVWEVAGPSSANPIDLL